jgi:hypothetical protein
LRRGPTDVNGRRTHRAIRLLLGLEVVEEDAALLALLTPVLDNDARAVDDLAGVALTIDLAYSHILAPPPQKKKISEKRTKTSPLAELLAIRDLDEGNLVLGAQGNNKLLVRLLLARLVQDAHVCLATIEGLGGLAQTARESVVDERELENALERLEHGHLALGARLIGRDLDLGGRADLGLGIVFSVRLLG